MTMENKNTSFIFFSRSSASYLVIMYLCGIIERKVIEIKNPHANLENSTQDNTLQYKNDMREERKTHFISFAFAPTFFRSKFRCQKNHRQDSPTRFLFDYFFSPLNGFDISDTNRGKKHAS